MTVRTFPSGSDGYGTINRKFMNKLKNKDFKLVISNTASQLIVKTLTSFTTFLVALSVTYLFGIKAFGSFTKITTFVSFFYLLVNFGMNPVYLKEYHQRVEKLFFNLVTLRLFISSFLFLIILLTISFLPYNSTSDTGFSQFEKVGILLFSLTLFTQALTSSINTIFQKNLVYHLSILPQIFSSIAILMSIPMAKLYQNISAILMSYSISGLIFFFSSYRLVKKRFSLRAKIEQMVSFSRGIIRSSLPLGLMLLFNLIYFRIDTLILSLYRSSFDVGAYGFSYKIFEFIVAFPTFFSNSVYPILISKEKNIAEFYHHILNYSLFLFIISLLCAFAVFLFSPILNLRQDFSYSILPLRILSLSLPFFFLTSLLQWVLIIQNQKILLLVIYFFSMITNTILDIIYIPQFGNTAAASITVFSEFIIFLLLAISIFWSRKLKLRTQPVSTLESQF